MPRLRGNVKALVRRLQRTVIAGDLPHGVNFPSRRRFLLVTLAERPYSGFAQFRTCLWLRAGRWISGQEAGKTPFVWEAGQPARLTEYGPAAGGEPAAPPEAGDAAQSNDGAGFFGLGWSSKDWLPKRLVHLAGRADGFSLPNDGAEQFVTRVTDRFAFNGAAPSVPQGAGIGRIAAVPRLHRAGNDDASELLTSPDPA